MINYDKIKQAEEKLKQSLKGLKNKDEIFEAINQLVETKIEEAIKDFQHYTRGTGEYGRDH